MNFQRWKAVLFGVHKNVLADKLTIVSAGMAYYLILGLFPALAAFVLLYGIFSSPTEVQNQITGMGNFLPGDIQEAIVSQISKISSQSTEAGLGAIVSILVTLWSGSRAAKALVTSLNIAYGENETRGFLKFSLLGLGLTISGIVIGVIAIGFIVLIPAILGFLNLNMGTAIILEIARWVLLVGLFMGILALLYRFVPDRKPPRWAWVTPGAILATVLWAVASFAFSWYVSNFGNYNEIYGSFGAAIIFLLWLYISSFLILLGAEFNQQIEKTGHKEREDTS